MPARPTNDPFACAAPRPLLITDANGRVLSHVQRLDDDSIQPVYQVAFIDIDSTATEMMTGERYAVRVPIERVICSATLGSSPASSACRKSADTSGRTP